MGRSFSGQYFYSPNSYCAALRVVNGYELESRRDPPKTEQTFKWAISIELMIAHDAVYLLSSQARNLLEMYKKKFELLVGRLSMVAYGMVTLLQHI